MKATKSKLVHMLKVGMLEDIERELVRYGTIIGNARFTVKEGRYAGENRHTIFLHHGLRWEVDKLNGEIIGLGYDPA